MAVGKDGICGFHIAVSLVDADNCNVVELLHREIISSLRASSAPSSAKAFPVMFVCLPGYHRT